MSRATVSKSRSKAKAKPKAKAAAKAKPAAKARATSKAKPAAKAKASSKAASKAKPAAKAKAKAARTTKAKSASKGTATSKAASKTTRKKAARKKAARKKATARSAAAGKPKARTRATQAAASDARELFQIVDPSGAPVGDLPQLDAAALRDLFVSMLRVRVVDGRMLKLQRAGRVGFVGTSTGQEASMIGSAAALQTQDWLWSGLREGGAAVMRGLPLSEYVAQMYCNSNDTAKGRQMCNHF